MITIVDALHSLRPNAAWCLSGNDYEGLKWYDANQTMPTNLEVSAEILRLQAEYDAKQYQRDRASEYPPITDYIDGVVKGDQAQIQAYIDACLAVKAKYPKGA